MEKLSRRRWRQSPGQPPPAGCWRLGHSPSTCTTEIHSHLSWFAGPSKTWRGKPANNSRGRFRFGWTEQYSSFVVGGLAANPQPYLRPALPRTIENAQRGFEVPCGIPRAVQKVAWSTRKNAADDCPHSEAECRPFHPPECMRRGMTVEYFSKSSGNGISRTRRSWGTLSAPHLAFLHQTPICDIRMRSRPCRGTELFAGTQKRKPAEQGSWNIGSFFPQDASRLQIETAASAPLPKRMAHYTPKRHHMTLIPLQHPCPCFHRSAFGGTP